MGGWVSGWGVGGWVWWGAGEGAEGGCVCVWGGGGGGGGERIVAQEAKADGWRARVAGAPAPAAAQPAAKRLVQPARRAPCTPARPLLQTGLGPFAPFDPLGMRSDETR